MIHLLVDLQNQLILKIRVGNHIQLDSELINERLT